MPYRFRVCFELHGERPFNSDLERTEFFSKITKERLELVPVAPERRINAARLFVLTGPEYSTEQEAREAGEAAMAAIVYYALKARKGIDLGRWRLSSTLTKAGREFFEKKLGAPVYSDRLGLIVYETPPQPRFVGFRAKATVSSPVEQFTTPVAEAFRQYQIPSDDVELAANFYGMSFFEGSIRGRLLTLVTALEVLIGPRRGYDTREAVAHIEQLMECMRAADLEPKSRDRLLGRLGGLKKESIGQAGARLVAEMLGVRTYDGRSPAEFFARLYDQRSALLHRGKFDPKEANRMLNSAQNFVADFILAHLASVDSSETGEG